MTLGQVKDRLSAHFFQNNPLRWVHGIAIGVQTEGKPHKAGKRPAQQILVFLEPSVPCCELEEITGLIKRLAGNNFSIVMTSRFVGLQAATGTSISYYAPYRDNVPQVSAGTFGAVVEVGGKRYILGSNHVLAHNGRTGFDADVVAPSTRDATARTAIGSVSHVVELIPPPWPLKGAPKARANKADCALAEIRPGAGIAASTEVRLFTGTLLGTAIIQEGRSPGAKRSRISLIQWDGFIAFSFGTYYFADLMGTLGRDEFALPGDSGSLVRAESVDTGVGLVTARAYTYDSNHELSGYVILFCSLSRVRDQLAVLFATSPGQLTFRRDS
ncbi:MAG TPA: hypothetical protein VFV34_16620 [Blastocatellia bacterium]|nr:hypothetical protein [Blastocatellia bacterium]